MGQRIGRQTTDGIANIGARVPRDTGQALALDKRSDLTTASPMPAQRGSTP